MKNLIAFTLFLFFCCVIQAQSGYYVNIDGVKGESTDAAHEGWVDLLSFSQALNKPGGGMTGQSRRRGSVVLEDIVCVKKLDKSSPKLQEAVCKGKVFRDVEIHLTTTIGGDMETYCTYELKNCRITAYNISGDADDRPTEEISINFEQIKVIYTEYDSDGGKVGNVEYTWKLEKGMK